MKAILLSDSHGNFKQVLPFLNKAVQDKIDLIIHSGDISPHFLTDGGYGSYSDREGQKKYFIQKWCKFLNQNKSIKMVMIAGNHDFFLSDLRDKPKFYDWDFNRDNDVKSIGYIPSDVVQNIPDNLVLLNSTSINIFGLNIYGDSWTPYFYNWAFNLKINDKSHWKDIPDNVDILITHGPPYGILDKNEHGKGMNCGDINLLQQIESNRIKPMLHVFGHIHCNRPYTINDESIFVNASLCQENNKVKLNPYIVQIDIDNKKLISCKQYQI